MLKAAQTSCPGWIRPWTSHKFCIHAHTNSNFSVMERKQSLRTISIFFPGTSSNVGCTRASDSPSLLFPVSWPSIDWALVYADRGLWLTLNEVRHFCKWLYLLWLDSTVRAKTPYFNVKKILTPSRPGVGQALGGVRVGGEAALEQPVKAAASALPLRAFALLQPVVRRRTLVTVEAVATD